MELLKKLNYKDQSGVWVLTAPAEFVETVRAIELVVPVHTNAPSRTGAIPFLLAFVMSREELETVLAQVTGHLDSATTLWFAYPKKSSKRYSCNLNRDAGWEPLGLKGYEPVRQIALNEDWSALRFKPVGEIKKLTRKAEMVLSQEARRRLEE